jgi:hypothetical protein
MRVAILQPTYWARCHVWNRVADCDVFIWLDHVKFSRNADKWEDRTIIEGGDGRSVVLRLPLRGSRNATWLDAGLNDGWQRQARSIQQCYSRAPQWSIVQETIAPVYSERAETIDEVCWRTFKSVQKRLGLRCDLVRSHELGVESSKGELVLDLVREVGGDVYISGAPGLTYLPVDDFRRAGVHIAVQDWLAPQTRNGLANPSIIHLLAYNPVDDVRRIVST